MVTDPIVHCRPTELRRHSAHPLIYIQSSSKTYLLMNCESADFA